MLTALEKTALDGFRSGAPLPADLQPGEAEDWLRFGLRLLLDAGRMVRERCPGAGGTKVEIKSDGSPVTLLEQEIERLLQQRLDAFAPGTVVVGEETGGALPEKGLAIAIDPVDGTWAFLNGTETFATTLGIFENGEPLLGMVSNPATGQISHAVRGGEARLVQLSLYREPDSAGTLPRTSATTSGILVNLHPSRTGGAVVTALFEAWRDSGVKAVRSPGGSPAWAMVEAARGDFVYVNLWSKRPAEAYDLVAGGMIVGAAGGQVVDLEDRPVDLIGHSGPFIAAVDDAARQEVIRIIRDPAASLR